MIYGIVNEKFISHHAFQNILQFHSNSVVHSVKSANFPILTSSNPIVCPQAVYLSNVPSNKNLSIIVLIRIHILRIEHQSSFEIILIFVATSFQFIILFDTFCFSLATKREGEQMIKSCKTNFKSRLLPSPR